VEGGARPSARTPGRRGPLEYAADPLAPTPRDTRQDEPAATPGPGGAPLACTVRGCGARLTRTANTWRCEAGHTFDVARQGYVNLLQPQDRRSSDAGDSAEAVAARARSLERGHGTELFDALLELIRTLGLGPGHVVAELGCGTGRLARRLVSELGVQVVAIDISRPAIVQAARDTAGGPAPFWVIANADRRLPLADASVDLVLAVHGRRNEEEVARVLRDGGHWLVAVPAADDLAELRAGVQGSATERSRLDTLTEALLDAPGPPVLRPTERGVVRVRHVLGREELTDLCAGTYRGLRRSEAARVAALAPLEVTFASEWLVARRAVR
jgi:23S rRNA (guanine745-N1)-methyltransferase